MKRVDSIIRKDPDEALCDLRRMGEAACGASLSEALYGLGWKVLPCDGVGFLGFRSNGKRFYWTGLAAETEWDAMLLIVKNGGFHLEDVQ